MNKWKIVAVLALLVTLLSFNWDRIELESRAFVVTLGIDSADTDDARFEVSMNIAHTADKEGGGTNSVIMRRAQGDSLAHAMGQLEASISEKVYFGHTKAIVLGEAVLQDASLLREVVDTLSRNSEIGIGTIVTATDKKAAEVLAARPKEQGLLGVYLSGFFNSKSPGSKGSANTASSAVKLDLEHLDLHLLTSGGVLIPLITLESDDEADNDDDGGSTDNSDSETDSADKEVIINGVAVVRDYALEGYISQDDMRGFLWLAESAAGTRVALETDSGHVTMLISTSSVRYGFSEKDVALVCRVTLKAEGSIQGMDYADRADALFGPDKMVMYQSDFADEIRAEAMAVLDILQDYAVDGLGLKERLRKKDRALFHRFASDGDWCAAYESMAFEVDVDVVIRNAGAVK